MAQGTLDGWFKKHKTEPVADVSLTEQTSLPEQKQGQCDTEEADTEGRTPPPTPMATDEPTQGSGSSDTHMQDSTTDATIAETSSDTAAVQGGSGERAAVAATPAASAAPAEYRIPAEYCLPDDYVDAWDREHVSAVPIPPRRAAHSPPRRAAHSPPRRAAHSPLHHTASSPPRRCTARCWRRAVPPLAPPPAPTPQPPPVEPLLSPCLRLWQTHFWPSKHQ